MRGPVRQASKAVFAAADAVVSGLPEPKVLIYHQVGGGSGLEMEVTAEDFERHLEWLGRHFHVAAIDAEHGADSVVLTFDDGYRSVYEIAFPLLRERRMPFLLYLTTSPIETGRPLRDHPGAEPLDWDMVGEMLDSGLLTIGSHTHSHPDLRNLTRSDTARELEMADTLIEGRIGVAPAHFAYPWGYWSEEADRIVRTRYLTAALGSPLPYRRVDDSHLLYRSPVQLSDGWRWFPYRVRGGLLMEEALRRRIRGYRGP